MASDFGEEGESSVHSAAEHSDSASHEAEYVNPRGVRFMPHQQHKDGKLVKINKLVAFRTNLPKHFVVVGEDSVVDAEFITPTTLYFEVILILFLTHRKWSIGSVRVAMCSRALPLPNFTDKST